MDHIVDDLFVIGQRYPSTDLTIGTTKTSLAVSLTE
jgi:hypothetical protein